MTKKSKSKTKSSSSNKKVVGRQKKMWWAIGGIAVLAIVGAVCFNQYCGYQLNKTAAEVSQLVQPMSGVNVQVVGKSVFMMGEVGSIQDYAKARSIAQTMKGGGCTGVSVSNLTRMSEAAKQSVVQELNKSIRDRRIRVRVVEDRFILEGSVRNEYDADRAVELARAVLLFDKSPNRPLASEGSSGTPSSGSDAFAPVLLDMIEIQN